MAPDENDYPNDPFHLPETPACGRKANCRGGARGDSRAMRRQTLYLPPAVHEQLRLLAFNRRESPSKNGKASICVAGSSSTTDPATYQAQKNGTNLALNSYA